jgi:thiamine-monophosphate kinase
VGARIDLEKLPLSNELVSKHGQEKAREFALAGGDDYELCLSATAARRTDVLAVANACSCPIREIGVVESKPGVRCRDRGSEVIVNVAGYDHFRV